MNWLGHGLRYPFQHRPLVLVANLISGTVIGLFALVASKSVKT